jgi:phospholipid/cholesterol/gamma-HCH transport system substrate-binding protein
MTDHKRISEVVNKDWDERVYHRRPSGASGFKLGVLVAIVLLALGYLAFAKSLPFGSEEYEITAVFDSSVTLLPSNPVRIAGVNVGEVTGIERKGDGTGVTFTVDPEGRPVHADASATIRPRLFLEGNFFIDLSPGSPSAEVLSDGDTIPVSQTARAVQLDEILTSLQQNDRENLSRLLRGYGDALLREPTAADDADQDPDVQGETAAQALNDAFRYGGRAGRSSAQVTQALRGTEPGDLPRLLRGGSRVFAALAAREQELRELITNFNITTGALASESSNLSATVRELAPTIEDARPSLARLNETFPPLRTFARAVRPAVNELPATIEAGTPWLRQGDLLLSRSELGGIAQLLGRATPDLATATRSSKGLLRETDRLSRCTSEVLVPTGNVVIEDDFATGVENYKAFLFGAVAQAGEGQSFDGNGSYLRVQPSGGPVLTRADNPKGVFRETELNAWTIAPPIGTQPTRPGAKPPIRSDVPCHENRIPDLNGPAAAVGPPSPEAVP